MFTILNKKYNKGLIAKFIVLTMILTLSSCIKAPDFGDTPTLTFVSMNRDSMLQGDLNTDSVLVVMEFTDGNGDIGASAQDNIINMVITDNRNGAVYDRVKLPELPLNGSGNGVKGTITLTIYNGCCLFDDKPNCTSVPNESNALSFDIYMMDRAMNMSNTITTSSISLICQ